jgi:hypothetical protein
MLTNKRLGYVILIVIVIALGISSRKIEGFPLFVGDTLYAVMVYFGMRFFFINSGFTKPIIFTLIFCFGIELLQLFNAEWLLEIRKTTLGHYVLGQGFLWCDLGFYILGITMASVTDIYLIKRKK